MVSKNSKAEIYTKVLNAAIGLDFKYGHLHWTMTRLAKTTGISRTLIYYYFGRSKLDILTEAVHLLGRELAGFSQEKVKLWEENKIAESHLSSRKLLGEIPTLIPFYYMHRQRPTKLGKLIQKIEIDFQEKLNRFFPAKPQTTIEAIQGLFFGLSFAPNLSDEAVRKGIDIVLKGLQKN